MSELGQEYRQEADRLEAMISDYQCIVEKLVSKNLKLGNALAEVRELIEGYVDVVDGPEGQPAPNKAMKAVQIIDEVL